MEKINKEIIKLLKDAGIKDPKSLNTPPKPEMGDLAFPVFDYAKGKNPAEFAKKLADKISTGKDSSISEVRAFGPYVNFYINSSVLADLVFKTMKKEGKKYGSNKAGNKKNIVVEFAHPNTHKAFHIGHLRNILTGESISRLLENGGYNVTRVNYQGDVGMHIAKALYGIEQMKDEYKKVQKKDIHEKIAFLGKAYSEGSTAFEKNEKAKEQIIKNNEYIYTKDSSVEEVYETTRAWSLEYFDLIYRRVGTKFERLYFESEVFTRGVEIVNENIKKGIFKKSDGAIIFEGSKHGLHDRVFINSKGYATYEGKEMALAELQVKEHAPNKIIHITGREQKEYFSVVFKALEKIFPNIKGKEEHMWYGWVSLKKGKMSSRTGKVVLGEWLLDEVKKMIEEKMKDSDVKDKESAVEKISGGAVKYSMLKTGVQNDSSFDINESISTSGNSGPYLQYICARIKSILRKGEYKESTKVGVKDIEIHHAEKNILLLLAKYPDVTKSAMLEYDPSKVAQYLFNMAQLFNVFYESCVVLDNDTEIKNYRLQLISNVLAVMEHGLGLLGIETVEKM